MQERSDEIRSSSQRLNNNLITPDQYLNRIVYIYTKKFDGILRNGIQLSGSENSSETTSENNDNIEESFAELSVCEPEQQQKGVCISCRSAQCDIILVPCYHIVVCSKCWNDQAEYHKQQTKILFKNNKRKQAIEEKKVPCPCCDKIVLQAQEFFMATINQ